MDTNCTGCSNFNVCKNIQEGGCIGCPQSMQKLAEESCKFGSEDCIYVDDECENLDKEVKCKLSEKILEEEKCPRCFSEDLIPGNRYITEASFMAGGAKMKLEKLMKCKRCKLKATKIFDAVK